MARFRRLRKSMAIRRALQETALSAHDFVQPFFVLEGKKKKETIESMPGIFRVSTDLLLKDVDRFVKAGGQSGLLFGLPSHKDSHASLAYSDKSVVTQAIRLIKKEFPEFIVMTDVCLCAYTDHGHCGIIHNGKVDNDKTLPLLGKMAVAHAQAGADFVAPSDMMDMRVARIRKDLDQEDLNDVGILSYAVKYASAFYGPFREAANSSPQFGDRKTYQMNPGNAREALKEAKEDIKEGADMVMVKPALSYLDIVSLLKRELSCPIVAYSVSGEYALVKAAAEKKWINERDIVLESHLSMKRAGADLIISYFAQDLVKWIKE
jgi:porphobilinogen synthase